MKKMIIMMTLAFGVFFTGIVGNHKAEASSNYRINAAIIGQKYIGIPYKWGGTTTNGFDCSGFVSFTYKKTGKVLPRTSYEMYKRGKPVAKKNLQKGDLVFYSTYKKGASHVGIYLGNNKFVHAASKGVKVDSLNNSYWKSKYIGAKRV